MPDQIARKPVIPQTALELKYTSISCMILERKRKAFNKLE